MLGQRREHRPVLASGRRRGAVVVALAQDQPVLRVARQPRRHEGPRPTQPLAMQAHGQAAVAFLLHEVVRPAVPDLDRAGAVVPGRDLALERRVLERMVLDLHREMLLSGLERNAFRHRPGGEGAVTLEAEVVMEPPGVVPLDDEGVLRGPRPRAGGRNRLRRRARVSLLLVPAEVVAHEAFLARALSVRAADRGSACIRSRAHHPPEREEPEGRVADLRDAGVVPRAPETEGLARAGTGTSEPRRRFGLRISLSGTQRGVDTRGRCLPASSRTSTVHVPYEHRGISLWTVWTAPFRGMPKLLKPVESCSQA